MLLLTCVARKVAHTHVPIQRVWVEDVFPKSSEDMQILPASRPAHSNRAVWFAVLVSSTPDSCVLCYNVLCSVLSFLSFQNYSRI